MGNHEFPEAYKKRNFRFILKYSGGISSLKTALHVISSQNIALYKNPVVLVQAGT